MKKQFLIVVLLAAGSLLFASVEIAAGADVLFAQDFLISKTAVQFAIDCRVAFSDSYEFRLIPAVSFTKDSSFLDCGAFAICYPYKGLFFGVSVIQLGFALSGDRLTEKTYALNEIIAGWTFDLKNGIYIEPSIIVRDPSCTYSEEYSAIRGVFPCYSIARLRCCVGYKFNAGGAGGEKKK